MFKLLGLSLLSNIIFSAKVDRNFAGKYAYNTKEEPSMCHMTPSYPPNATTALEWYTINLDEDASTRWSIPVTKYKNEINDMLDVILTSIDKTPISPYIRLHVNEYMRRLPKDYAKEIEGIANILNRGKNSLEDTFLFNIAYEIFGLCTSIIAQDTEGHIYHGRNLDFGLWPSVNWTDVQWNLTTKLRPTLFNAQFMKNNQILYKTTVFGGYVGLLTGVKKGAMTITVNSRYDNHYDKFLIDWLRHPDDKSQWLSFVTRMAMEDYNDYNSAVSYIRNTSFVGPCYIIIGGVKSNEGSILSIGPNMTLFNQWDILNGLPQNNTFQKPFYVLETNYDHWEQPPFFDDRRYPAEKCMDEIGSKGMAYSTLFNVLNAIPNRNRLTTYTALMNAQEGDLVAYKQWCNATECIPW